MSTQSLAEYSAQPGNYEPVAPTLAKWRGSNGSVDVLIIAYSLGATLAFCVIGTNAVLEPGNYSATWLPVSQLQYP